MLIKKFPARRHLCITRKIQNLCAESVRFVLKQPFAAFPSAIASGYFGIASPDVIEKAGATYGTPSSTAVETGSFVFKEWRSGDRVVLEKNPNYWKEGFISEQLSVVHCSLITVH